MKSPIYIGLGIVAVVSILFLLPTPDTSTNEQQTHTTNSIKLINLDYFDGKKWHEDAELIIEHGRVVKTTDNILPSVDMQGKYAIPGLIDAHTHTFGDALQQALRFGVTTEMDMFTNVQFMQQEQQNREQLLNTMKADLFSAGTLVTSQKGHGTQFGMRIPTLNNAEQALAFVEDRVQEGSDYIKIVYHHDSDYYSRYTSIDNASLISAINAAKKLGKKAVVHVSDLASARDVIDAGADGLVHTFGDEIVPQDLLDRMKAQGTFIIPTLSVIASFSKSNHSKTLAKSETLAPRMNQTVVSQLTATFEMGDGMSDQLANAMENTRLMHEAGIPILAGSDAPNPGTSHGVSLHGELTLLVQSGLSITEALQAASYNVNQHFDIGERGHLLTGARADMLIVDNDPRLAIENTQSIYAVYKNGFKQQTSFSQLETAKLKNGVISHFQQADLSASTGNSFIATSDKMLQGNSEASIDWIAQGCKDAGALSVTGNIAPSYLFPWAGTYLQLNKQMDKGIDLTGFSQLTFSHKANDKRHEGAYQLMVFMPMVQQPQVISFSVTESCSTEIIVFSDYPQVNWRNISGLAWVAGQDQDQFSFLLDNIALE